jgi:hypothetical protein
LAVKSSFDERTSDCMTGACCSVHVGADKVEWVVIRNSSTHKVEEYLIDVKPYGY